jgi:photosystem II stability/assembly factor-like uncharacterized protein
LSRPSNTFLAEAGVRVDYSALDFFFVNESTGFFMTHGGERHVCKAKLYKTVDGGRNWSLIDDALPGNPTKMHFSSDKEGYISVWGKVECAGEIHNPVLKTIDGGHSWIPIGNAGLPSYPTVLDIDTDGAIYALVSSWASNQAIPTWILLKSTDGMGSWSEIYRFAHGDRIVSATTLDDALYIGFDTGKVSAIDANGTPITEFDTGGLGMSDFEVASENVALAVITTDTGQSLVRTIDRGNTWDTLLDGFFRLVSVPSPEEIILIVNKGSSAPTDTATSLDVVAYSNDGGNTWEESPLIGGLIMNTKRRQSIGNKTHKLLLSDRVLSVTTP